MPWTTSNGAKIEHAYSIAGLPASKWTERDKHWLTHYRHIEDVASALDREVFTLRAENLRLKHENEFMLRLINQKGGEPA